MKKLMMAVASAMVFAVSAQAAEWFDAGIEGRTEWPTDGSNLVIANQGTWTNTASAQLKSTGLLAVSSDSDEPLAFIAAKPMELLGDSKTASTVSIFTKVLPTPTDVVNDETELEAPPEGTKAAITLIHSTAKEEAGEDAYNWACWDMNDACWEATYDWFGECPTEPVTLKVCSENDNASLVYYIDEGSGYSTVGESVFPIEIESAILSGVELIGDGEISSLTSTYEPMSIVFTLEAPENAEVTKVMSGSVELEPDDDGKYTLEEAGTIKVTYMVTEVGYLFSNGQETMVVDIEVKSAGEIEAPEGTETYEAEATDGSTYYLTVQEAFDSGEQYITLCKDVEVDAPVVVAAGSTVSLDLGEYTLKAPETAAIHNYGTLAIANGTVEAQEAAIVFWGNSSTTIEGGTYKAADNAVLMGSGNEGEGDCSLTIEGGDFYGSIESAGYIACGVYVPNSGTYNISGRFNITGGCGVCARAGTVKISNAVFNLSGDLTATGKVGDKSTLVPCVAAYFDWSKPDYPGYTEGDTIYSANKISTAEGQKWSDEEAIEGYYKLEEDRGPTPIEDCTVTLSQDTFVYDPNAYWQRPDVTVTYKGEELTEDVDYTLDWDVFYSHNADTYTVDVNGIGDYSGSVTRQYEITPLEVTPVVSFDQDVVEYEPGMELPDPTVEDFEDYEYEFSWAPDTIEEPEEGMTNTYYCTVTMIGNYTGESTGEYKVYKPAPEPAYPEFIDDMDEENKALYDAWATVYGVTDPTTVKKDAFLLNCDNTDEAIAEAKEEFKIQSITIDAEGNVTVEGPDQDDYNGTVVLRGSAELNGTYTTEAVSQKTAKFFKAYLEFIPAN